jgi:hypothetical protein
LVGAYDLATELVAMLACVDQGRSAVVLVAYELDFMDKPDFRLFKYPPEDVDDTDLTPALVGA